VLVVPGTVAECVECLVAERNLTHPPVLRRADHSFRYRLANDQATSVEVGVDPAKANELAVAETRAHPLFDGRREQLSQDRQVVVDGLLREAGGGFSGLEFLYFGKANLVKSEFAEGRHEVDPQDLSLRDKRSSTDTSSARVSCSTRRVRIGAILRTRRNRPSLPTA
jgi:hypothetical protein